MHASYEKTNFYVPTFDLAIGDIDACIRRKKEIFEI